MWEEDENVKDHKHNLPLTIKSFFTRKHKEKRNSCNDIDWSTEEYITILAKVHDSSDIGNDVSYIARSPFR